MAVAARQGSSRTTEAGRLAPPSALRRLPAHRRSCRSPAHASSESSTVQWLDALEELHELENDGAAASALEASPSTELEPERCFMVAWSPKLPPSKGKNSAMTTERSLQELAALAETAGLQVVGSATQNLERPDRRTFLGSGRLVEVVAEARAAKADTLLFDEELSPSQGRNIEAALGEGMRVADRTALILDIFASRAATREGALQTALASLDYQLPRLTRMWTHLDRTRGGGQNKGEGERQLEIDKRLLKESRQRLMDKLESVRTHREQLRKRRTVAAVPVVALVGYTSAGKSSMLNRLAGSDVLVDAALFSTLDPTTRRILLPSGAPCLVSDTVGFIAKLPTQLIAAFRSTLEETSEASLLLHIVDASLDDFEPNVAAVESVLRSIGVPEETPLLEVWNKVDLLDADRRTQLELMALKRPHPVCLASASTGDGIAELLSQIGEELEKGLVEVEACIPLDRLEVLAQVRKHGALLSEEYTADGVLLSARVPLAVSRRLSEWRLR